MQDYQAKVKPVWCPGCGDFSVLTVLYRALADRNLDPENVVIVSGIGCSGRLPIFVNSFGFHGVHGRVLPTAMGVKIANPELTVIAVGGDGDGLAIGGGHFPHAARRNIDITYIMMDNNIYGLTKGQASPTTAPHFESRSSPYGTTEDTLNPIGLSLAYNVPFIARGYSAKPNQMLDLFLEGIEHKGFSFIQVMSPCVVFNDTYKFYNERVVPIPENHDPSDKLRALELWQDPGKIYLGKFYRDDRPDFHARQATFMSRFQKRPAGDVEELLSQHA